MLSKARLFSIHSISSDVPAEEREATDRPATVFQDPTASRHSTSTSASSSSNPTTSWHSTLISASFSLKPYCKPLSFDLYILPFDIYCKQALYVDLYILFLDVSCEVSPSLMIAMSGFGGHVTDSAAADYGLLFFASRPSTSTFAFSNLRSGRSGRYSNRREGQSHLDWTERDFWKLMGEWDEAMDKRETEDGK